MRRPRLKAAPDAPTAFYHCISRVVDRRFIFKDPEREQFVRLMRQYEAFCGLRVLTYVVMSNHFHILVEVPRRPDLMPSADVILSRIEALHGPLQAKNVRDLLASMTARDANQHLDEYWRRMHDVSWFIRLIKQRFSQWYNARRARHGTLWEERFKSVLVEGAGHALAAIAAYIDLNPVRARVVTDPKDYRWCGYAEAVAGGATAREGLRRVMKGLEKRKWDGVLEGYRVWVFGQADDARGHGGIAPERADEAIRNKGALPISELLRCRIRHFVEGAVIGSRDFVEAVFLDGRWSAGPGRRTSARRLQGLSDVGLFSLQALRLRRLSSTSTAGETPPRVDDA